ISTNSFCMLSYSPQYLVVGEFFGISGKINVSQVISQDTLIDFYHTVLWICMAIHQRPTNCCFSRSYKAVKDRMESCDPVGTLIKIKDKLDLDQNGIPFDATKYHSMIGALMYLTSSRPDIVHATCLCAQYQAKPTEKHLKEVKRIFRYLRGTINTGLCYTKDSGFELTRFSDADYTGYKDTFKSTSSGA
nr:uncharacterized mitochondrial protein AtMg00810-like [Tanacetum cinerariifolium]